MCPARRIFSISEDDLQTIDILNCAKRLRHDLFYRLLAIHLNQPSSGPVIVNQGQRLLLIGVHALYKNAFLIVWARHK
jgi:hypothetical protein